MSRQFLIIALSLASVISTPLGAQTANSGPADQSTIADVTQAERKICREETRTGTRIAAKKICKTAKEWAQTQRKDEAGVNDLFENKGTSYLNEPTGLPK